VRNSDRIARLLGEKEEVSDHSLRAHSLKRAMTASVPRTLTPYEWEQWYEQYGVPESHTRPSEAAVSWWQRLFGRKPRNSPN
jgi:hypothetical protein